MQKQLSLDGFIDDTQPARTKPDKQGTRANVTGNAAENTIECVLQSKRIVYMRQHVIGVSIYDHPLKVDFYIPPCPRIPNGLIIESKWQESGGSVDEKYVYVVENIRRRYPVPCLIVLDGDGYKAGAKAYLKNQVDGCKLIAVQTISEFLTWSNRNL